MHSHFLDIDPRTLNIDTSQLESALSERTKAVMLAHTLGNPFDLYEVIKFCKKYNLWLIEDNCDALGSIYRMPVESANKIGIFESSPGIKSPDGYISRWTGTLGDVSTQSFYPPHHITMGEGGLVNFPHDLRLAKSNASKVYPLRLGQRLLVNSCSKRFEWQKGELPQGYDHKYVYSHFGQAGIGLEQLNRLDSFIKLRQRNWGYLRRSLDS